MFRRIVSVQERIEYSLRVWRGLLLLGLLAVAACAQPAANPTPYSGLIAASEFVVGENRFPFGLVSRDGGFMEEAEVTARFYDLNETEPRLRGEAKATWRAITGVSPHRHPDGTIHEHLDFQGVYVVDSIVLDKPGFWQARFTVVDKEGRAVTTEPAAFEVASTASAPAVGQRVPATRNRTIHDVAQFSDISTRLVEDDMHEVSVAQALEEKKPFVVVFASPQFCVSAMCGPVTDSMAQAHERFKDRGVHFIHIEPWDLKAAREEGRLVPSEAAVEWRLPTEPWTFVVDGEGRIAKRFEGLVTPDEVTGALEAVLAEAP